MTAPVVHALPGPRAALRHAARVLLPRTARVVLAVSGGSDSVALLGAACEEFAGRLLVVHVHHGLRPAATADADFVADLCARLAVPCELAHAPPTPAEPSRSETAARRRRLAALADAARRHASPWILLGHHLDDDLETLLLRLRRGHAGSRALAGMPVRRPLDGGACLLRPFLALAGPPDRAALAAFRARAGLPCVEDESNGDLAIPRNACRAWLAAQPPATRADLLALRSAARSRLQRWLREATERLALHFRGAGLGSRLAAEAREPPPDTPRDEFRAERLRHLGAALQRPRRVDPRAAVLRELQARRARGGWLDLPAAPAPLRALLRDGALELPDEPPAAGEPAERALAALLAGPLHA